MCLKREKNTQNFRIINECQLDWLENHVFEEEETKTPLRRPAYFGRFCHFIYTFLVQVLSSVVFFFRFKRKMCSPFPNICSLNFQTWNNLTKREKKKSEAESTQTCITHYGFFGFWYFIKCCFASFLFLFHWCIPCSCTHKASWILSIDSINSKHLLHIQLNAIVCSLISRWASGFALFWERTHHDTIRYKMDSSSIYSNLMVSVRFSEICIDFTHAAVVCRSFVAVHLRVVKLVNILSTV